jgi:hypothetical protein
MLKGAVGRQTIPVDLETKVRARLMSDRLAPGRRWRSWLPITAVVVTAAAACAIVFWLHQPLPPLPDIADRTAQDAFILSISNTLAAPMRPGLCDHVHCAVFRRYPRNPPSMEQLAADLGPIYRGLLPVLGSRVPEGYHTLMAHQCSYRGRSYIHVAFRKGVSLLSLVITRKRPGESLTVGPPAGVPGGVPIFGAAAERFQIAAFDAGDYLAYVVSDLQRSENLQVAKLVAGDVRGFLMSVRG